MTIYSTLLGHVKTRIAIAKLIKKNRCQILNGEEIGKDISIDSLICPLRYDIIIRINFFKYYSRNRQLFTSDFKSFIDHPFVNAFYTWYKEVAVARFEPKLYSSDDLIHTNFLEKVYSATKLYDSIETNGFNVSYPILIQSGLTIQYEDNKEINAKYYAGDGCHRLACLYVLGIRSLPRNYYKLLLFEKFRPLDNTKILINKLSLSLEEYFRFISYYYCDNNKFENIKDIVDYLKTRDQDRLNAVLSIVNVDIRQF